MATTIWNPKKVFKVDPDAENFTCIGTNAYHGRCSKEIPIEDRIRASGILHEMATHPPDSENVESNTPILVALNLCSLHRHDQKDYIHLKWRHILRGHIFAVETLATGRHVRLEEECNFLAEIAERLAKVTKRMLHFANQTTTLVSRRPPPRPTKPKLPSVEGHTHAAPTRRKPITEGCPICLEPICCNDNTVWCRAACGTNMHRACFAGWRTEWRRASRYNHFFEIPSGRMGCPFCRTEWKRDWEE